MCGMFGDPKPPAPTWTLILRSQWTAKGDTVLPGYRTAEAAKAVGDRCVALRLVNADGEEYDSVYAGFAVVPGPERHP